MVQSVEIGVGQQRTDDRPLGGAGFGRTPPFAGFHHTLLEHPSDQFQNGSIGNVLGDYGQEFILRYAIEIAFEVGVHHPDFPLLEELNDSPKRVFGSSPRPESVAVFGKEFLEDWFEHVAQRHFDDPIFDFGHTEAAFLCFPVWVSRPVAQAWAGIGRFESWFAMAEAAVRFGRRIAGICVHRLSGGFCLRPPFPQLALDSPSSRLYPSDYTIGLL